MQTAIAAAIEESQFEQEYAKIWDGDEHWRGLPSPTGALFDWDPASTYVREATFFDPAVSPPVSGDIEGARILVKVGDSITTDHISPAGSIKADSPAGRYLLEQGVAIRDFNSYGSRRGNHEVMVRGTFANIRLRNELAPGTEGSWSTHLPDEQVASVYDVALRYQAEGVPLGVLAGAEYGSGSSRDWAAKGPLLLGVRFVIAESYERIHRSNLVGMGILPLQFLAGDTAATLGLTGREVFAVRGLAAGITPGQRAQVDGDRARTGRRSRSRSTLRVDAPVELDVHSHSRPPGGVLCRVIGPGAAAHARGVVTEGRYSTLPGVVVCRAR